MNGNKSHLYERSWICHEFQVLVCHQYEDVCHPYEQQQVLSPVIFLPIFYVRLWMKRTNIKAVPG